MFLEKNLAVLAKRYPQMAEAIRNTKETGRYKLTPSQRKDGLPTLVDLKLNRNYYNNLDPQLLVEQDMARRNILLPELFLVLGLGLGYHLAQIVGKSTSARVMVVEHDLELVKVTLTNINLVNVLSLSNVDFMFGVDLSYMYPQMFNFFNKNSNLAFLKALNVVELEVPLNSNMQYYVGVIRVAKDAIAGTLALYGNDPYDSLLGIKYTLRNISTIIDNPGIKELEGIFKGKPGVVVATGPSLNKNVKLLEGIYDKAVIVGVDASVKVLKKHNLKPAHMVTSLERVIETSYLFEGLTEEDTKDSFFSACPVIVPETYANFPGEKIIVYRNFATFKWIDIEKGILDIGPSSANMAFKILEFLGCDPIILIGQDLSYSSDMKSHAEGFHYGETADVGIYQSLQIPGNYEPTVNTTDIWYQFLKHYERDISAYKGTVINATEGGAKIVGTTLMTFQEAIDKYMKDDLNVIKTIRDNLKYSPKKIKLNQEREVLKKLYHAKDYCEKKIEKLNGGVKLCFEYEELVRACNAKPNDEEKAKMEAKLKEIIDFHMSIVDNDFYLILMHYVQAFFIKAAMDINAMRAANQPSIELNMVLMVKYKEKFSVLASLIEKIHEEFVVSIDILEQYEKQLKNK